MELPTEFQSKMKHLLKDEYEAFMKSYHEEKSQGLRVNILKIDKHRFESLTPFTLTSIPWVEEGFYYLNTERPGQHPYHDAGLYYIQEPSAMAVGEFVDAKPGERILDLCAAPGGKTTHIAMKMKQSGLLVANEIYPKRAKILSQNIERMGIKNAVVTNERPEKLAKKFSGFFDRILVDAPCSGEGMFRKDPDAIDEWSPDKVRQCAIRQQHILESAKKMLKVGGTLVYSTCTFSPEENEGTINQFIKKNPDFSIEKVTIYDGFDRGRLNWMEDPIDGIEDTFRIWPHQVKGEGHFVAVLRKKDGEEVRKYKYAKTIHFKSLLKNYYQFAKDNLYETPEGHFAMFGDQLYLLPEGMVDLEKLKVVRPGWHLGTLKKNCFKPSHALAICLQHHDVKRTMNFDKNEIIKYLKGESMMATGEKGWHLIEVDGFSIGWGKLSNGILKNHYPKGLRWKIQ